MPSTSADYDEAGMQDDSLQQGHAVVMGTSDWPFYLTSTDFRQRPHQVLELAEIIMAVFQRMLIVGRLP